MAIKNIRQIISSLPPQPGIYKYYDSGNHIIYIGKAKNLRKRVSSYFTKTLTNYKTHELVQRIARVEFTIVNSEQDAFLLENALIKQYRPRYNISLKDDRSYPYIVIRKEPFPRVFLTRKKTADGSDYLGPFTSVRKVSELLEFIKKTIPLRSCTLNLSEKNIQKGKFKVCLEYHLGNCKGPCEGLQTAGEYHESLEQAKNLLKGNLGPVLRFFKNEMKRYAGNMEFEKAETVKRKIDFLKTYRAKSVIVNKKVADADVFFLVKEKSIAYVNYLMVRNGIIIQTHTSRLEIHLDESPREILSFSVASMRQAFESDAGEIIVPVPIHYPGDKIIISVPRGGEKKKLLELAEKNALYYITELRNKEQLKRITGKTENQDLLKQVQKDLQLPEVPGHIECFDNSNLHGSYPVAAMVCFKNGQPDKKHYRRFHIKTVKGINDVASMYEAVTRRYRRLLADKEPFPQLIIIDGGKGQLNAALKALEDLQATGNTTVTGLAKNEEELFFPGDKHSVKLPLNSESLKLIRKIRDEVHRFGLSFHRDIRSKGTFKNELEHIPGIGKHTANKLLKAFNSTRKIKEAEEIELEKVIGKSKAALLCQYFTKNR